MDNGHMVTYVFFCFKVAYNPVQKETKGADAMKFSEVMKEEWEALQPYLDTCLLPVTGLTGREQPWQATEALEKLRDALDLIEIPYKGRVVTYPAVHYVEGMDLSVQINTLGSRLKEAGFAYVIVLTTDSDSQSWVKQSVDEIFYIDMTKFIDHQSVMKTEISRQLQLLWR
jgi:23S rRNA (pseudouridine1915-N3)-methyltransferase